jgi:hypothetical protein
LLQVRYQFPNVLRLDSGNGRSFAQLPFSLLSFARKQMALEPFVSLDLPARGHSKSFSCRFVSFDLGQFLFLSI